ncbi:MAG: 50S ribosomal protein L5 [Candidatus Gracilibacteria bacterium]|jgi:large subunit ribosomal protein L5|nr:50S ribosomal protein L5 [Candidatus Gracilibacteria bacterium]
MAKSNQNNSERKDLFTLYKETIVPELKKQLNEKNVMALPKLTKITINAGIGTYVKKQGQKDFSHIVENLERISGQKPVTTLSKKAISNFKIREGEPLGVIVTLRGKKMYDFMNKLINIVLPRVRDFRGVSRKSFDGNGNYSLGFKEHLAFPEIKPDDVMKIHGLQVNICTNAKDNAKALALLEAFGFPFKKN